MSINTLIWQFSFFGASSSEYSLVHLIFKIKLSFSTLGLMHTAGPSAYLWSALQPSCSSSLKHDVYWKPSDHRPHSPATQDHIWPWETLRSQCCSAEIAKRPEKLLCHLLPVSLITSKSHPDFFQLCSYLSKFTAGNKGGPACLLYNNKTPQNHPFVRSWQ